MSTEPIEKLLKMIRDLDGSDLHISAGMPPKIRVHGHLRPVTKEPLTNEQVDRVAQSRCAPNEKIIRFGEPCRLDSFWVAIMKGDPGNSGQGLVHRSPPVEGTGQIRTLFCLDS